MLRLIFCCLLLGVGLPDAVWAQESMEGQWEAAIQCPGGEIRFGIDMQRSDTGQWQAWLTNGEERIAVPKVQIDQKQIVLEIDHFDSQLKLSPVADQHWQGKWRKRRTASDYLTMDVKAERVDETNSPETLPVAANDFIGRWEVQFSSSEDPAVGIFQRRGERVHGTFLTTTGDYRYLDGTIQEIKGKDRMILSCFDGAHAFLFHAEVEADDHLQGDFWSSDKWHETWTAVRNSQAELPDDFRQTITKEDPDWSTYQFPDLEGRSVSLSDPKFAGDVRIIYVFGSWCPNCHDAARFLSELDKVYGKQGLSILGLAFELTGDQQRDAEQVRKYLERHGCQYPVLLAGLADKQKASEVLPFLDRVRSFPTTIFLDHDGRVVAVHTGFTGPATGEAYDRLKTRFKEIIEKQLR